MEFVIEEDEKLVDTTKMMELNYTEVGRLLGKL
jgi:hypothetical protein